MFPVQRCFTESEYRKIKRTNSNKTKYKREAQGSIYDIDNFKGPWAEYIDMKQICKKETLSEQKTNPFCKKYKLEMKYCLNEYDNKIERIIPQKAFVIHKYRRGITALQYFNNYELLASAGKDGRVIIHQNGTSRLFIGHNTPVVGIGLSIDERFITSVEHSGRILGWEIEQGKCKADIELGKEVSSFCQSEYLTGIGCSSGEILFVDARAETIIKYNTFSSSAINSLSIINNTVIICNQMGELIFSDIRNEKNIRKNNKKYNRIYKSKFTDRIVAVSGQVAEIIENEQVVECFSLECFSSNIELLDGKYQLCYGNREGAVLFPHLDYKLAANRGTINSIAINYRNNSEIAIGMENGEIMKCM